jgi:glucose/arabinose dehydrogenase
LSTLAKSAAPLTRTPNPSPTANPAPAASPDPEAESPGAKTEPQNDEQFVVEQVMDGDTTGSLLAMTFNEFGHVVASREQGGVVLIYDANRDGLVDQVRVASDQVKDCRGLLCLNGELFATGQGPEGLALYRLTDQDRDGQFERIQAVLKFEGSGGRYGPHGLALGTDGLLYVAVGCQTKPAAPVDPASPYRDSYEGDLVAPRYEDPDQELAQVRAPAGSILRLTPDGRQLQAVAGGLYDATDLAFDHLGELFAQDSEAAADVGTPWFRHAAVYHVLPGAEFGWRSGSAKWPEHFVDRLPPTLETGRGQVTGMTFYHHYAFPEEYRNSLFLANWTLGKISALKLKPSGGSYSATSELFVDDPSLHVTDLAVGPDGALYFVTGDQGMAGGLYRIRWTGKVPPHAKDWGSGLSAVIRQPQLEAAWSRQRLAADKAALAKDWERSILGVATSSANPWHYRSRALDLMQLFGPAPTAASLTPLAGAETEQVRAKAAELMGLHAGDETREALIGLLSDSDRIVCRLACESLARAGQTPPVDKLIELLKSDDRYTAWSARRLLERIPADQWSDRLLASDHHRLVLQSGLALLVAQPSPENARRVLDRLTVLAGGFTTDRDFVDMLRVMQVALSQGQLKPEDAAETARLLAEEFPSSDRLINRELMCLLTYLRVSSIMDRYLEYLGSADVHDVDKLHVALHLPLLSDGWNAGRQIQLIEFLDAAQGLHGGSSRASWVTKASRSFAQSLSDERVREILAEGDRWPHAAVALLYRLPHQLDAATLTTLKQLDERLQENRDSTTTRLKVGLVAVMARSGDAESLAYLRTLWESDPERRPAVAMGLAQWPTGENWNYLIRSLSIVESDVAREILEKLKQVELAPEEPEYYRQVILRGLELGGPGADAAIELLEHWTGTQQVADDDGKAQLAAWQNGSPRPGRTTRKRSLRFRAREISGSTRTWSASLPRVPPNRLPSRTGPRSSSRLVAPAAIAAATRARGTPRT